MKNSVITTTSTSGRPTADGWLIAIIAFAICISPRIPIPFINITGRIFDIRIEDIFISIAVAALLITFLTTRLKISLTILSVPMALYITTIMVSYIFNIPINLSLIPRILTTFSKEIEYFLIYLITINMIKNETDLRLVMRALVIAAILNVIWAIYQIIFTRGPLLQFGTKLLSEEAVRARGAFYGIAAIGEVSPFSVACLFSFLSFLFYSAYINKVKLFINNKYNILIAMALTLCALLTGEKISVVFLLISILIFTLLGKINIRIIINIAIIMVGSFIVILSGFGDNLKRILNPASYYSALFGHRVNDIWINFIPYIANRPLYGYGKGGVMYLNSQAIDGAIFNEIHNHYLMVTLESGILGLTAFLILLLITFGIIYTSYKKCENTPGVIFPMASLIIFTCMCAAAIVQDAFRPVIPNELLWLMTGLSVSAAKIYINKNNLLSQEQK